MSGPMTEQAERVVRTPGPWRRGVHCWYEALREALAELLAATIEDAGDGSDCPDDDGAVALCGDGKGSAVTFAMIRKARAALSGSPAPTRCPEETGWLVEMNDAGLKYYSFSERDHDDPWGGFQRDVSKATRFARKEDAEAMIAAFGWTPGHVYAAEHIWGGELEARSQSNAESL